MAQNQIQSYIELIELFVNKRISPMEFEEKYLEIHRSDNSWWSDEEFNILDPLFWDIDAYCGDPSIRSEQDIDEEQLHESSTSALFALKKLQST